MHNVPNLEAAFDENMYVLESAYRSFREFDAHSARDLDGTTDALWRIHLKAGDRGWQDSPWALVGRV